MKTVIIHEDAEQELKEAVQYYEARSQGLGAAFEETIYQAVQRIRENPTQYPFYKKLRVRKYSVERFPYVIFYGVFEDVIWIVAMAHGRRKPEYWTQRLSSDPFG
jgi:toxin ParE1/3/4